MEFVNEIFPSDTARRTRTYTAIWFFLALIAVIVELNRGTINNYLIFKNVFWHVWHRQNLYIHYPGEYNDLNHYGPLFSILIFPFAVLPDWLGVILWAMANTWMLFYAIQQLPVSRGNKDMIMMIAVIEMMTSIHNVQFNAITAAWIILSWVLTKKDKSVPATFLIMAGFLIKMYGIVGILFIVFSKDKRRFAGFLMLWFVVLLILPAVISSVPYLYQTYFDWFQAIIDKNAVNIRLNSFGIDVSVLGIIRRVFNLQHFASWYVILPAVIFTLLILIIRRTYDLLFQLKYLSLLLISICVFSSSAESPTYVIAVTGVAIWFTLSVNAGAIYDKILLFLVIVFTTLSQTDLFPAYFKIRWMRPYSLKALPCFLVWLKIVSELMVSKPRQKFKLYPV